MRNAIKEYIEYSSEEKSKLLKTATIVFDTNILLNLYRYTQQTRDALITVMQNNQDRLWIPYYVANEFMKNRISVIFESEARYKRYINEADAFLNNLAKDLNIEKDNEKYVRLKEYLLDWLQDVQKENVVVNDIDDDIILKRILELYEGKVGKPYDKNEVAEIEKEGKERFEKQIPPGFMDKKKDNGNNAYGDLLIWKQMIDYSISHEADIVYVTDDQKVDWWNIINGKTIGPRNELRKEFYDKTNRKVHFYNMLSFIKYMNDEKKIDNIEKITNEIKDVSSIKSSLEIIGLQKLGLDPCRLDDLFKEIEDITEQNKKRRSFMSFIQTKVNNGTSTDDDLYEYEKKLDEIHEANNRLDQINKELNYLRLVGLNNL